MRPTVKESTKLKVAAKIMVEEKIGSIIVVDDENKPIGVVTRTDVLIHFVSSDPVDPNVPVKRFLKSKLITISPNDQTDLASQLFSENRLHHLVVQDKDGKLVGVVSTLDIIDLQYKLNRSFPYIIHKK
jgi:CBS domain-containing protein